MAKRKLGRAAEKAREARKRKRRQKEWAISLAKEFLVAIIIVLIVMGTLYVYCGIWPPMVVVESQSMMHGSDSQIGIIDTGDLTLVKKVDTRHDIVTYVEGRGTYTVHWTDYINNGTGLTPQPQSGLFHGPKADYRAYGDYGDVIIYQKNGRSVETPVIHRAMLWFVPNVTDACKSRSPMGVGGDYPDIKNSQYPNGLTCISELTLKDVGYKHEDLFISAPVIISHAINIEKPAFAGFITKGDYNPFPDQSQGGLSDNLGRPLAPNKLEWVVGKAVGELPWFGAPKLVTTGTPSDKIPPSSWTGLISTIVLIIVIMLIIDIATSQYAKRKAKEKKKPRDETDDGEEPVVKRKPKQAKKEHDEVIEEIDLDEYGDEFKDMATSKPIKKNKR
jgi:signal peptidase